MVSQVLRFCAESPYALNGSAIIESVKPNVGFRESFLYDWPHEYYLLSPAEKECALQEQLRRFPDSRDDRRRSSLFHKRYSRSYDDLFMMAWMMLKVADGQEMQYFNFTRYRYEVETELKRLLILGETADDILKAEWRSFADDLIGTHFRNPSGSVYLPGFDYSSGRNTALRLAAEIEAVTKNVPEKARYRNEVLPFRAILLERFRVLVPGGNEVLKETQIF